jgi:CheY-like chemotaxis protein
MNLSGIRVLVTDGNPVNQMLLKKMLVRLGCDVRVASSGAAAIKSWDSIHFDLVVMDCQMPEMDGVKATRQIRRSSVAGATVPIIALAIDDSGGERDLALLAGVSDFLPKHLVAKNLEAVLHRALFRARRQAGDIDWVVDGRLRAASNH